MFGANDDAIDHKPSSLILCSHIFFEVDLVGPFEDVATLELLLLVLDASYSVVANNET